MVETASLYDNFCKTGNDVINDVISVDSSEDFIGRDGLRFSLSLIVSEL